MSGLVVSAASTPLLDLPRDQGETLVVLEQGLRLAPLGERDWDGWKRVYADIPGTGRFEGYVLGRDLVPAPVEGEAPEPLKPYALSWLRATRRELELLHPGFRVRIEKVLADCKAENLPFEMFEGYRSPHRQRDLYAYGRTDKSRGIVTHAGPWQSLHQYGLAADLVLRIDGRWSWAGEPRWWDRMNAIGRSHGLEPLSFEKPHLQMAGYGGKGAWRRLYEGQFPEGGDETWRIGLERTLLSWSEPAPKLPWTDQERPAYA